MWRGIVFGLLLALGVASVSAAPPPSIRDRVIAIIRAKLPRATIVPTDAHGFSIKQPNRDASEISVQRIEDFCAVNPRRDCDDEVTNFAASTVDIATTDFAVTPQRLRVIVRNRLDTDGYLATIKEADKQPLVRPLFDDVSAVLAADFPRGTRLLNAADLAALKLDSDAAFALGTRQVLADLPPVPKLAEIDGKLITLQGYDYGASVMLLPERWAALATASGGRLYVAIPGDGGVMVGMTKPGEDTAWLKRFEAEEYRLSPRGISARVYRWSPTGWVALP